MSKYDIIISNKSGVITCDVYDILKGANVTCPALQHLIKKALHVGIRGHKDKLEDLQDIIDSANRAKELECSTFQSSDIIIINKSELVNF